MYFAVFKAKFCGVYDGKWGFYSTQTYLTLLRLWIDILFDTQTFDSVYLSNVNNRFSIKTGYRYPPLVITANSGIISSVFLHKNFSYGYSVNLPH